MPQSPLDRRTTNPSLGRWTTALAGGLAATLIVGGLWAATRALARTAAANAKIEVAAFVPPPSTDVPRVRRVLENRAPRRSLMVAAAQVTEARVAPSVEAARVDPVLNAMLPDGEISIMVEVAQLRDRPVGIALRECLLQKKPDRIPFFDAIDRIGLSGDDAIVLQGRVQDADVRDEMFPNATQRNRGDGVTMLELESGSGTRPLGAVVDDDMAIIGDWRRRSLDEAIERVRNPSATPAIPKWAQRGQIYGTLSKNAIRPLFRKLPGPVRHMARESVEFATVSVDATDRVVVTVELYGNDIDKLGVIARVLSAGVSMLPRNGPFKAVEDLNVEVRDDRLIITATADPEALVATTPECR